MGFEVLERGFSLSKERRKKGWKGFSKDSWHCHSCCCESKSVVDLFFCLIVVDLFFCLIVVDLFFCLICTISSELNYFLIFTHLSEPGLISAGSQWIGSTVTPAGFQEAFHAT